MSDATGPGTRGVKGRLTSLDALRGFSMFWILGGDSIGHSLAQMQGSDLGVFRVVSTQLNHVDWEGFRFYDLIFPLFIFIVGVSIVFSLTKIGAKGGRRAATVRVIRRGFLLWLIGVLYYGGWSEGIYNAETNVGIRLMGVLQRIGICYLSAGLLFLYLKPRGLLVSLVGILVGYWALLSFVPVPGVGAVSFEEGKNLTNWVDAQYLPFFKWDGDHDPEGLLSNLPAIGTCLLGVFAGLLLRDRTVADTRKVALLAGAGVVAILLGYLWGLQFPVIKKLWTSSYVLVAGGWSALLLALFYWAIDMKGCKRWSAPFVWIGLNPILIYVLGSVISFDEVAARVLGGPVEAWADGLAAGSGAVLISIGGMLLAVCICWFLQRKKLFVRL